MHKKWPLVVIGLQQSLGCGRSSINFFFFFFTRNDPILYRGISNTTAFFIGRNVFYKSVCNCNFWAVYCLLFVIILPYEQTYTYKVEKKMRQIKYCRDQESGVSPFDCKTVSRIIGFFSN